MLCPRSPWLALLLLAGPVTLSAQAPTPPPPSVPAAARTYVEGYVVTTEIRALAPEMKTPGKAPGEAAMLAEKLRQQAQLVSRFHLTRSLSRQEILSTDFILPQGTLVLHNSGDRFYVIADPRDKTYLVMDAAALLNALEGGAGIVNAQYEAKVQHTPDRKTIAGLACRKSIVTVTYVSSIPFENSTVLVQQKNDIEIWHTSALVSSAAMDHFFFKFQRDKTGTVQKALAADIGFPMEVSLVVTQGGGTGPKAASAQPGSFHFVVTDVKIEKKLEPELFTIPPPGYRKVERSPFFKEGALSNAGARMAGESPRQR